MHTASSESHGKSSSMAMPAPSKTSLRIVLAGGGHSHVLFLKNWRMNPVPGTEVVLISKDCVAPYSGMLPGRLAGWYEDQDIHFHLHNICAQTGVTFIEDEVVGMDLRHSSLLLRERPPLYFDLASINVGITPELPPGAAGHPHVLSVKPISTLLARWKGGDGGGEWTVVGGGAAGFEIAVILALKGGAVTLLEADEEILTGHGPAVQSLGRRRLAALGVNVRTKCRVVEAAGQELVLAGGERAGFKEAVFTTGARAPKWLAASGLPVSDRGFLLVDEFLRAQGHAKILGAGDCLELGVPRAGVYAVREAPVLAHNIRATLYGGDLRPFRPQKRFLALLTSGERRAMMSYYGFALEGGRLWKWKRHIDSKFLRRFDADPDVAPMLPGENTCGGCGGKVEPEILHEVLHGLGPPAGHIEDCGWLADVAVTVDGFRSFTPDLYFFGEVACWHALNDLYAAGVLPQGVAVNACLPPARGNVRVSRLRHLMAGVLNTLTQVNARLINAHTSESYETSLGITALGRGSRRWSKSAVRPGLNLVLSKPLGTGVALQALMIGALEPEHWRELRAMLRQGHHDVIARLSVPVAAATDVSGFGLLGHMHEMLGDLGANLDALPELESFRKLSAKGISTHLAGANARFYQRYWKGGEAPPVAFDPQTHGPLLFAVEEAFTGPLLQHLNQCGFDKARVIGRVAERQGIGFIA